MKLLSLCLSFSDGTAKGGSKIEDGVDYIASDGVLEFKHGETTKPVVIDVSKHAKVMS